jgi:hypothetical protein
MLKSNAKILLGKYSEVITIPPWSIGERVVLKTGIKGDFYILFLKNTFDL